MHLFLFFIFVAAVAFFLGHLMERREARRALLYTLLNISSGINAVLVQSSDRYLPLLQQMNIKIKSEYLRLLHGGSPAETLKSLPDLRPQVFQAAAIAEAAQKTE